MTTTLSFWRVLSSSRTRKSARPTSPGFNVRGNLFRLARDQVGAGGPDAPGAVGQHHLVAAVVFDAGRDPFEARAPALERRLMPWAGLDEPGLDRHRRRLARFLCDHTDEGARGGVGKGEVGAAGAPAPGRGRRYARAAAADRGRRRSEDNRAAARPTPPTTPVPAAARRSFGRGESRCSGVVRSRDAGKRALKPAKASSGRSSSTVTGQPLTSTISVSRCSSAAKRVTRGWRRQGIVRRPHGTQALRTLDVDLVGACRQIVESHPAVEIGCCVRGRRGGAA